MLCVLRPEQHGDWMNVLWRSYRYDFYHLPCYHSLAEQRGEGRAYLFVYTDGPFVIAMPLLQRPVQTTPGLREKGEGWHDATTVYGYAGPVASHQEIPASTVQGFTRALSETLGQRRVVCAFSRLHPLIPQHALLSGFGEQKVIGRTVSIDLTLPAEAQRARFRKSHKRDITRLQKSGVECVYDRELTHLEAFIQIYHETMDRVHARAEYFFEPEYFHWLTASLGAHMHLFVCLMNGTVISGGLFGLCNGIVQYHLGGTRNDRRELASTKLLFNTVRLWGHARGAHTFHLGGGAESQEDSLLHFKQGFSDRLHDFAVWRAVLLPDVYAQLCQEKTLWNSRRGLEPIGTDYFPAYRCPSVRTGRSDSADRNSRAETSALSRRMGTEPS